MIDSQIIESAQLIRKKFLKLNNELDGYQKEIGILIDFLKIKIVELQKYNKEKIEKIKNKEDIKTVSETLVKKIEEIEVEEKKLNKKVSHINDEMEKLKKDEEILYGTIRQRYPDLTDEQIINAIHSNLER